MVSFSIKEKRVDNDQRPDTVLFIVIVNLGFGLDYPLATFCTREAAEEFMSICEQMEERKKEIRELLLEKESQLQEREWQKFVERLQALYQRWWEELKKEFIEEQEETMRPKP